MEYRNIANEPPIKKQFTAVETASIQKSWDDIFLKNKQGVSTNQFKWHIFSSGRYPSVTGDAARGEYSKQIAAEYIVLSNEKDLAFSTIIKPSKFRWSDFYIFPLNMAWTMAFTHEDGWLGPYFALHPEYKKLNLVNEEYRKKLHQKAIAEESGWC